tara:strand:- start:1909 stop:2064 length:156 start_codon:yes stop_codon:yes gene_type:complete
MNTLKNMWHKFDTKMTSSYLGLCLMMNNIPDSIFFLAVTLWAFGMAILAFI